jgi:phospholipid transport system substrate-binding protein
MRNLVYSLLLALVAVVPANAANVPATTSTPGLGPQELMEQVSQELLREIDANRAALAKDPARLRAVIDQFLLPHFDTDYSARLVLGKHWRTATAEQRKRFIEAFYKALMKDYGEAILEFTADRLRFLPFRGDPNADTATVRTEVRRDSGQMVPVNYTMRRTPEGWKAWDVTIEGISYIRNFRADFGAEVDQQGIEHLIKRLETQGIGAADRPTQAAASDASSAKPARGATQ